ncbi:MAG: hypothetical protein ABSD74_03920 [Rhizomicrobium sp.]|jgi:ElaB/YqjD/DUF883 family membrane-anchored ribosome-binding protein
MPVISDTDVEALSHEMSTLRAQVSKIAELLGDTANHAGDNLTNEVSARGRWFLKGVEQETAPYVREIEDHPVVSAAFAFGALGLFLGIIFARRA